MTYQYTFEGKTYEVTVKEVAATSATTLDGDKDKVPPPPPPKPKKRIDKILPIIIVQL